MIVIIDYGMGNLRSILMKFKRIKAEAIISADCADIEHADKLILPGVGYFAAGMKNLRDSGLIPVLNKKVLECHVPLLGICLGMQLLTKFSEEGDSAGLGWIDAVTKKFHFSVPQDKLRIPHMGWNTIDKKRESVLLNGIIPDNRFYFAHTYAVSCNDNSDIVAATRYGYEFVSIVQKGNIYGTQFHPEKSHYHGLKLIENFVRLT
jgi:imidazole glycerol phosphate synthase, glutamine amidotransferase subunit